MNISRSKIIFLYLFQGVEMLPPANTIKIDKNTDSIQHNSWWDFDFTQTDKSISFNEAKLKTEFLFKKAVSKQMITMFPLDHICLGYRFGSITALASKKVDRLSTFTCGFDMVRFLVE